jgi:hypothetical protein
MLLRYTASADNTIVNAYQQNLKTRGTGANAGQADVVEVFSVYGRQTPQTPTQSGSQELSRYLVKFPIDSISADRTAGTVPTAGNVSFYLRMFNAPTSKTVPIEYKLGIHKITQEWEEGIGLDLEGYKDLVKGNIGSDWIQRKKGANWTTVGGTYSVSTNEFVEQHFSTGLENIEIDITSMVEQWITTPASNYGMLVKLSSSYEAYFSSSTGANTGSLIHNPDGATVSYYTKRFFARGTQYYYKRPLIEARWNDVTRDDRTNFYYSSSRATSQDNLNTLYFYNVIRGRLTDIPGVGTGSILISLYGGNAADSAPSGSKLLLYDGNTNITGGHVSTGIYSCSMAITSAATPLDTLYDVWHSGGVEYFTGSISPLSYTTGMTAGPTTYYINITNLKNSYSNNEIVRLNLYSRNKNWEPNIYTVANSTPDVVPIVSSSYRVYRILDGLEVVPYGTGSEHHTGLSYDVGGNYFDFDMSLLEAGYQYAFKFAFYDDIAKSWQEQDETFKFKVEEF